MPIKLLDKASVLRRNDAFVSTMIVMSSVDTDNYIMFLIGVCITMNNHTKSND